MSQLQARLMAPRNPPTPPVPAVQTNNSSSSKNNHNNNSHHNINLASSSSPLSSNSDHSSLDGLVTDVNNSHHQEPQLIIGSTNGPTLSSLALKMTNAANNCINQQHPQQQQSNNVHVNSSSSSNANSTSISNSNGTTTTMAPSPPSTLPQLGHKITLQPRATELVLAAVMKSANNNNNNNIVGSLATSSPTTTTTTPINSHPPSQQQQIHIMPQTIHTSQYQLSIGAPIEQRPIPPSEQQNNHTESSANSQLRAHLLAGTVASTAAPTLAAQLSAPTTALQQQQNQHTPQFYVTTSSATAAVAGSNLQATRLPPHHQHHVHHPPPPTISTVDLQQLLAAAAAASGGTPSVELPGPQDQSNSSSTAAIHRLISVLGQQSQSHQPPVVVQRRPTDLEGLLERLESRAEQTLSRARHLQASQVVRHVSEQMAYFVAYEQRRTAVKCQWKGHAHHPTAAQRQQQQSAAATQPQLRLQITSNGTVISTGAAPTIGSNGGQIPLGSNGLQQVSSVAGVSQLELVNIVDRMKKGSLSSINISNGTITATASSPSPQVNGMTPTTTTTKKGSKKNSASSTPTASQAALLQFHHQQQQQQQQVQQSQPHSGIGSWSAGNSKIISAAANLSSDAIVSLDTAVAQLERDLAHFERVVDSDATDSSSGGESADEHEDFPLADLSSGPLASASATTGSGSGKMSHNNSLSSPLSPALGGGGNPLASPSSHRPQIPIRKRALSRWAAERSSIAARWTWLQAQVADLEFRARQQDNWYKSLRMAKGACQFICTTASLADPPPPPPSGNVINKSTSLSSSASASTAKSSSATTTTTNPLLSRTALDLASAATTPPPNKCDTPTTASPRETPPASEDDDEAAPAAGGMEDAGRGDDETTLDGNEEPPGGCATPPPPQIVPPCARHLALDRVSFKRRKLVHAHRVLNRGAVTSHRRAARFSTASCPCASLSSSSSLSTRISPCVLCSGRHTYRVTLDTHGMPYMERVALLDQATHPVLSTTNDVSLGLHFAKLLKREAHQRIQPKPAVKKKKLPALPHRNKSPAAGPSSGSAAAAATTAAHPPLKKSLPTSFSSSALKRKLTNAKRVEQRRSSAGSGNQHPKRTKTLSQSSDKAAAARGGAGGDSDSESSDGWSSPLPSPYGEGNVHTGATGHSTAAGRRRRSENSNAFDIDNIVIPLSIAASTRIERLEYKEIITPKWRHVPRAKPPPTPQPVDISPIKEETAAEAVAAAAEVSVKKEASELATAAETPTKKRSEAALLDDLVNVVSPADVSPTKTDLTTSTTTPKSTSNGLVAMATPSSDATKKDLTSTTTSKSRAPPLHKCRADGNVTTSSFASSNGNVASSLVHDVDENTMDVDTVDGARRHSQPSLPLVDEDLTLEGPLGGDDVEEEEEDGEEDISDEAYLARHTKCEAAERARLMAYMKGGNNSSKAARGQRNRSLSERVQLATPSTPGGGGGGSGSAVVASPSYEPCGDSSSQGLGPEPLDDQPDDGDELEELEDHDEHEEDLSLSEL